MCLSVYLSLFCSFLFRPPPARPRSVYCYSDNDSSWPPYSSSHFIFLSYLLRLERQRILILRAHAYMSIKVGRARVWRKEKRSGETDRKGVFFCACARIFTPFFFLFSFSFLFLLSFSLSLSLSLYLFSLSLSL